MAGVGGRGRRRRLGAGRPGTGVYGRIDRVYQDRHHHLSHNNHAVGGRDECAVVAEGRKVSIIPDECRSQPGTLIGVGPGYTRFRDSLTHELRRTPYSGSPTSENYPSTTLGE